MSRRFALLCLAVLAIGALVRYSPGQVAVSIPPQVTRQTSSARLARTPAPGELIFDTTLGSLWAGNGLTVGGVGLSESVPLTTVSATYGAATTDSVILANASSGPFTITLPTAVGCSQKQFTIKKIDVTNNEVTIATSASQTIDGAATFVLDPPNSVTVVSDGSNWWIL